MKKYSQHIISVVSFIAAVATIIGVFYQVENKNIDNRVEQKISFEGDSNNLSQKIEKSNMPNNKDNSISQTIEFKGNKNDVEQIKAITE